MILKAHIQDAEFLQREIEITMKLDHPNIVRLFAVYEAQGYIGNTYEKHCATESEYVMYNFISFYRLPYACH